MTPSYLGKAKVWIDNQEIECQVYENHLMIESDLPDSPFPEMGIALKIRNSNGLTSWYKKGKLHRENGPAKYNNMMEEWWFEGMLHRENGPAIISKKSQAESWYHMGELHRNPTDGPAVTKISGQVKYYIKGKPLTKLKAE